MASAPSYAATPRHAQAAITGAPGAGFRSGSVTTSFVDIITGGTNGTRLERVILKHTGVNASAATAALSVLFYVYNGTAYRLICEVDVGTVGTPAAGTATWQAPVPILEGLLLPDNTYKVAAVIAGWVDADDDFAVHIDAADY